MKLLQSLVVPVLLLEAAQAVAIQERQTQTCSSSPKATYPAGFVCNKMGTVNQSGRYSTLTGIASADVCADNCLASQPTCVSFGYNSANQECYLYNKKIVMQRFRANSGSSVTFWNRNCYKRTCTTNPPVCSPQCDDNATCVSGTCMCNANFDRCSNDPSAPCNVNLLTDNNNCGACGNVCGTNQQCSNGACACVEGTTNCGDASELNCANLSNDASNCGACGNQCPSGTCYDSYCSDCSNTFNCLNDNYNIGQSQCGAGSENECICYDISGSATAGKCGAGEGSGHPCSHTADCTVAGEFCSINNCATQNGTQGICLAQGEAVCANSASARRLFRSRGGSNAAEVQSNPLLTPPTHRLM